MNYLVRCESCKRTLCSPARRLTCPVCGDPVKCMRGDREDQLTMFEAGETPEEKLWN